MMIYIKIGTHSAMKMKTSKRNAPIVGEWIKVKELGEPNYLYQKVFIDGYKHEIDLYYASR